MKRLKYIAMALLVSGAVLFQSIISGFGGAPVYASEREQTGILWESYGQTIYNTTNGLLSNHVSSIAQTGDGVVWIGTDKGLAAFDGNEFTEYGSFYHFDGVNDIIRTAAGSVWFATTTYGGAIYLGQRFQHFDDVSTTVSNYASCVAEGTDGKIYVGTLRNMLCIDPAAGFVITEFGDGGFFYVKALAAGDKNRVGGVTAGGEVFFLKEGEETGRYEVLSDTLTCIAYGEGCFLAGTGGGSILIFDGENPEQGPVREVKVPIDAVAGADSRINNFFLEENRLWVLAEGGIGYYELEGNLLLETDLSKLPFTQCRFDDFESGFTDMMADYQGNYWIASSKRGVLLLGQSDFTDELSQLGLSVDRINGVLVKDGILYAATDSGLVMVDRDSKTVLENETTDFLAGKRLTGIVFYQDELFAAAYGEGVYRMGREPERISSMGRLRRLQVLDDMLYILSDEGCEVWDKERLAASYTAEEGMYNTRLTCALTGQFGRQSEKRVYLGSDGAGIYVFLDGEPELCIDENSGLPSRIINDMLPYQDGFFIATEGGIAYYNGKKLTELSGLPGKLKGIACKELYILEDQLYLVGDNAVYVLSLDRLFTAAAGEETGYKIFDENTGFFGAVTQGGHGCMDEEDRIYLPCGDKIYSLSGSFGESTSKDYKLLLQSVKGDHRENEIRTVQENEYAVDLSKDVEELEIFCSVLNFSNDDPSVRYILHGVDSEYTTLRSSELEHIVYEGLEGGSYTFWFELLDSQGETQQRIVLTVNKEKSLTEELWVRMAGLGAAFGILMYFVFKDRKTVYKRRTTDDGN